MSRVLVTGGTGFIAGHCILQLLEAGHEVRATVRHRSREDALRRTLASAGVEPGDRLSVAAADLTADAGWDAAVADCRYVLHVASPFPVGRPRHENDLIVPAREGTLRVLEAARDAGVHRVVLTSSFAAIGYGHPPRNVRYTETDWTNADNPAVSAYAKSKTLAERAAWDFIAREGKGLELAAVNPVGVFGPVLGADFSTSILLVKRMLEGAIPALPKMNFGVVDVRDVADLHLRAMTDPAAVGERFLAVSGDFLSIKDIAMVLKKRLGETAHKVPTRELPDWLVRLYSAFDPEVRTLVGELGNPRNATSDKAQRVLGWQPRSAQEAILSTAHSLIDQHLLA